HFIPVRLEADDWGRDWAVPAPTNGSGDFTGLAGTQGVVELPPGPNTYAKGLVTRPYRWSGRLERRNSPSPHCRRDRLDADSLWRKRCSYCRKPCPIVKSSCPCERWPRRGIPLPDRCATCAFR